jgi:hypothetical protein
MDKFFLKFLLLDDYFLLKQAKNESISTGDNENKRFEQKVEISVADN